MAVEFVEMVHPEVEGVGRVPKAALGHYVRAGWRPKDEADAEKSASRKKPVAPEES